MSAGEGGVELEARDVVGDLADDAVHLAVQLLARRVA